MRFAQLDDESRLQAMTELWAFDKHSGENINELLARFQVVREKVRTLPMQSNVNETRPFDNSTVIHIPAAKPHDQTTAQFGHGLSSHLPETNQRDSEIENREIFIPGPATRDRVPEHSHV